MQQQTLQSCRVAELQQQQQQQPLVPHHKPPAAEASLVLHKQSQHRLIYWPNCGDQLQLQIGVSVQHRTGKEEGGG